MTAAAALPPAPIAVAIDAPTRETALSLARQTGPYVSVVKVGLETYLRDGASIVRELADVSGCPVFLDLKLHDIPNTVAGAARSVASVHPRFLTVHALGGKAMIEAAAAELPDTWITGVTILTSLSDDDLVDLGLGKAAEAVLRLSVVAVSGGARALVCSPQEVAAVRAEVGDDVVLITPGVRPAGVAHDDQARVATPRAALADGANLLVVGRPITASSHPASAARSMAEDLAEVPMGWRRTDQGR